MEFNVLTRCTRPEHLKKVQESLKLSENNPERDWTTIRWKIIFDTSVVNSVDSKILSDLSSYDDGHLFTEFVFWKGEPGDFGHCLLNRAIDEVEDDGLIYILDDDNELHPLFYEGVTRTFRNYPNIGAFVFSQYIGGKDFTGLEIREADSLNMKVRHVDMAQFVIKKSFLGAKRLIPMTYTADGILMEELFNSNPGKFHIAKDILCNYNSLANTKPPGKAKSLPRILVVGEDPGEIKSAKVFDFENDDLNIKVTTEEEFLRSVASHDPDCILTTPENAGKSHLDFTSLCSTYSDIRKRWIHPGTDDKTAIGEMSYSCAMNYILNNDIHDLVSIITPIYNTGEKLRRTYQSVAAQTHSNWEWVLVNDSSDSVTLPIAEEIAAADPRVKVYDLKGKTGGIIGEAKYRGCVLSRGKYLFELDHDDYIHPRAVELMMNAFVKHPDAKFVYSDCAEITEDYQSLTYGPGFSFGYGSYREETHFGIVFQVANTANINPLTIRHIVGVPNHFRAWERDTYFKIGGHNRRLSIADDYELLVRTFLETKFVKIPYCCYFQFYHGSNSQDASRADIQRRVRTISNYYNEKIKMRFEELGKEDWGYPFGWNIPARFGEEEGFVNYIMEV
jgi:glycosyltransferase involved in cell wall biosynthesis